MSHDTYDAGLNPAHGEEGRSHDAEGALRVETKAGTRVSADGMTILVVEDDPSSASRLTRLLRSMGHEVVAAADGVEAWALIQRRRIDLVLSDWMMPESNGLELCRRIRALPGRPYTYVVMVSARGGSDDRLEALAAGADDFLAKPFDPRELIARLAIADRLLAVQDELERKNGELRSMATTDELTGLKNRRQFFEDLNYHFARATRGRAPLSLVLLDVDNFKAYNDAFGHPAGDEVLRGVAAALRSVTRAHETVARHGGEEFAVLLPGTDLDYARGMAERLRQAVERRPWPHRPVTASFGVAALTPETGEAQELVNQADNALYQSKRRGRNRVAHFAGFGNCPAGVTSIEAALPGRPPGRMALPAHESDDLPIAGSTTARHQAGFGEPLTSCDEIVEGWARALVLRDGETLDHSRRVTDLVLRLARVLGVREVELPHVRRGALLHDIGKIGVPDAILLKPGPLTDGEWAVMRRHPEFAYELLAPVAALRPALDIPYCHHERWDGRGYPRGLRGEQIPLTARAFAAIDVWDALSHDRPYRRAWSDERVRAHIAALAGKHLDPNVVAAFLHMLAPHQGISCDCAS